MQTAALIAEESRLEVEIAIAASEAAELEAALQRHGAKQQKPPPQARQALDAATCLAAIALPRHFCRQASEEALAKVTLLALGADSGTVHW